METIDCTPKWSEILPWMLSVIENTKLAPDVRTSIHAEFMRMAQAADKYNAFLRGSEMDEVEDSLPN